MNFIKRNAAFILLSVSLTVIISCFAYAIFKKDNVVFYLRDIAGDRSALSDITVAGVLQDRFHGRHFEISSGQVQHRFKYYQKAADMVQPEIRYLNSITHDNLVYSLSYGFKIPPDATTEIKSSAVDAYGNPYGNDMVKRTIIPNKVEITAHIDIKDKQFRFISGLDKFEMPTGIFVENDDSIFTLEEIVQIHSDGHQGETVRGRSRDYTIMASKPYYDSLGKCMTFLDGKLYFTIPTTKEYWGENGIFVVDEFGISLDKEEIGKGRKIAKWSLNDRTMDVLGLESINDKLVLITAINNILTLRLYDKHGTFLDQMAFENTVMDMPGKAGIDINSTINQNFEVFTNDNILNICIFDRGYNKHHTVISVEIGDRITPLQTIDGLDFDDNEMAQYYDIFTKGNKVYVVANLQRMDESDSPESYPLRSSRLVIMVYQNSRLIYKGELVTDADEDFEMDRLKGQATNYIQFDPFMYRQFYGIELR